MCLTQTREAVSPVNAIECCRKFAMIAHDVDLKLA
jgi:hypothetical protein